MKKSRLVQNIDEEVWRKFAGFCKMENVKVGDRLNVILKEYLKKEIK